MSTINRKAIRAKVRRRIRRKLSGTASRPRLAVYFSNRHVYAQIIDDTVGKTICSASTADASIADPSKLANRASATKVGNLIGNVRRPPMSLKSSSTAVASSSAAR